MRAALFALFVVVLPSAFADSCTDCIALGKHFCPEFNKCDVGFCPATVNKALNCPVDPDPANPYSDDFTRTKALVTIAAAYNMNPQLCFNNQLPTMKLSKAVDVNCSAIGLKSDCFAYTAVDTSQKVILMTFRGTTDNLQLDDELESFFEKKAPFFDSGNLLEYFYDGFMFLWNGGIQTDLRSLKFQYPDYTLWVHGHSLGGAMASIAASYVVKIGLFDPKNVQLLTFGQPRTGDYAYALWHDQTFNYSYRVIHRHDITPHIPPQTGSDPYYHHRFEVWYDNDMLPGQPYVICKEVEGLFCSSTAPDLSAADHPYYFGRQIIDWAQNNCAS